MSLGKPLYAVNHLVGHVGADLLDAHGGPGHPVELPTIALLVSGGHTSLLLVRDLVSDVELLGETIDDAAGEAFDKVARVLGLPYPGGPQIDRVAVDGDPKAIRFPRGLTSRKTWSSTATTSRSPGSRRPSPAGSSSGRMPASRCPVADVAASFREAVVDVLITKAHRRLRRPRRAPAAARRRRRRERPGAARSQPSARRRRASRCASRRCRCAPTTAR